MLALAKNILNAQKYKQFFKLMHRVAVVNHRVADFLNNTNIEPMPTTLQRSCVLCLSISSAGRTPAARPVFPSRLRGVATGLRFRRFIPKHRPNSPANRSRSAFGPAKPPSKCREADCSCWSCRCRAQAAEVSRLLAETSSRNQVRLGYERKLFTDSVKLSTYDDRQHRRGGRRLSRIMNTGSMRIDPKAMCELETQTGTSRFSHCSFFGHQRAVGDLVGPRVLTPMSPSFCT
jgi:hypothetical protein